MELTGPACAEAMNEAEEAKMKRKSGRQCRRGPS
jgi:hypothetical protein